MTSYADYLDTAIAAALTAGGLIRERMGTIRANEVTAKSAADFVTEIDTRCDELIVGIISQEYPDHAILAEESGQDAHRSDYRWIIDPLDGTTNFIHGFPHSSVSIALEERGELVVGVVFDPVKKELFTATKGGGATLNGTTIKVPSRAEVSAALLSTGFPFKRREMIDIYQTLFKRIFARVADIRRTGSAALDFAYVACGRFDGFFEIGLSPWDVAAGALLIREAGGLIASFSGGSDLYTNGDIIAGNSAVFAMLGEEVGAVFAP